MRVVLKVGPPVAAEELNRLFASAWPSRLNRDLAKELQRASLHVCAYEGQRLIGFVKMVDDGGLHGFLLDPTVSPDRQRRGIGKRLVQTCAQEARRRGIEWLHVDYEPRLRGFYRACGFSPTEAGCSI